MYNVATVKNQIIAFGSDENIRRNLTTFLRDKEAYSPNTWRQFLNVCRYWFEWAGRKGITPLPVNSEELREWILELYKDGRAINTINNYVAMLNMIHQQAGLMQPGADNVVKLALRKVSRLALSDGRVTEQAIPFKIDDLNAYDEATAHSDRIKDIRNRAFLYVAYNTILRISNLTNFRMRDVTFNPDGTVTLRVVQTKTTKDGEARIKKLSAPASAAVKRWAIAADLMGHDDAFLFCKVNDRSNKAVHSPTPLTNNTAVSIFHSAWQALGRAMPEKDYLRYGCWSGHSARVGGAQDMAENGYTLAQIMFEGMWAKPETVMGYLRHIKSANNALSNIIENKQPDESKNSKLDY